MFLNLKFSFLTVFSILTQVLSTQSSAGQNIVLVTGASSGIGKAIALKFSDDPRFFVYASMRDPKKWTEDTRENLKLIQMDVASEDSVNSAVSSIESTESRSIDVVINNAGFGLAGYLESVYIQEAKDLFDVNVFGPVRVSQAVLPGMRKSKKGHIINISSTSGIRGIPCYEFYTGSKFALEGIMDSLRYTVAQYNISITNVNAGPVRTSFTQRFGDAEKGGKGTRPVIADEHNYLENLTNQMVSSLSRRIESNEGQSSEEVAQVVTNIALLKLEATYPQQVPFNFGTSKESQNLLQSVKKFPTGWGGIFDGLLQATPKLPLRKLESHTNRQEEL